MFERSKRAQSLPLFKQKRSNSNARSILPLGNNNSIKIWSIRGYLRYFYGDEDYYQPKETRGGFDESSSEC